MGRGETLQSIAEKFGVTENQIIELNPDASQFIYVGMELVIPVKEAESDATVSTIETKESASQSKTTSFIYENSGNNTEIYNAPYHATKKSPVSWISANFLYGLEDGPSKYKMSYGLNMSFIVPIDYFFGIGFVSGLHTNLGIVESNANNDMLYLGPILSLSPDASGNFFISLPLCGYWNTRKVLNEDSLKESYKDKETFGFLMIPQLNIKLSKLVVTLGVDICFTKGKTGTALYTGLGFTF